ncbi:MAG: hypothetical protein J7L39_04190 [Candidatus Aenigmarchaeota archaeon]|nr:hypothetical protein [Candidatus Aenigmarchaeota archaeon]
MQRGEITISQFLISITLSLLVAFSLFFFITISTTKTKVIELYKVNFTVPVEKKEVSFYVPAVDQYGNGVSTVLKVEALPGKGRILVNINQLLFWIDTQQSIQIAKKVAEEITKKDLSDVDLIYNIETNASLIEGPSAGAAITIATIAALENKSINKSVVITGTINPDGSIGPVGGILPKAKAAKEIGATLFLVPKGQGTQVNYIPKKRCEQMGPITFCRITYKAEKINISNETGIKVKEISNIEEAIKYMLI